MAERRTPARLGYRRALRHRARAAPGRPALLRNRLVSEAIQSARGRRVEAIRDRIRWRDVECARLAERCRTRRTALRLHRLQLRTDAAPAIRQRERDRRPLDAGKGLIALVSGSGHLSQRLARCHGARLCRPVGYFRHHPGDLQRLRRRTDQDRDAQRHRRGAQGDARDGGARRRRQAGCQDHQRPRPRGQRHCEHDRKAHRSESRALGC